MVTATDLSLPADPTPEYQRRLAARRASALRCARWDRAITVGRRVLLGAVIGYVVFDPTEMFALVPTAAALVPLAVAQNVVLRRWRRNSRAAGYYQRGLARLTGHWVGRGTDGSQYLERGTLYADDLDIFGPGSLFQLLCTAQTPMGRDALADWLGAPGDLATIAARQRAVSALRPDIDFRESLAVLDGELERASGPDLLAWSAAPAIMPSTVQRAVGAALVAALVVSTFAALTVGGVAWPILPVVLVAEFLWYLRHRSRIVEVCEHVAAAGHTAAVLFRLRHLVHQVQDRSQVLADVDAALAAGLGLPGQRAAECYRLLLQNPVVHLLAVQAAPWIDQRRRQAAAAVPKAIEAAGALEALAALSAYACEHPADPFPELADGGPCFDAQGLGHPLMPADRCVRNDLRLGGGLQLIMVSGSNMSGKSTLLRSVGTNAALALAGAPVRAHRLRISRLALGTAMRFRDSVHEGASHFYAVLQRLQAVIALTTHELPLLFLFDEIMQGTNSQDRCLGSAAVLRKLVERGAIGLVTTHDLALTHIVDELAAKAANVHCEDQVVDGRMTFDYRIRPGIVTKTNALALMRAMGLDV